jgi:hypothetical protein
MRVSSGRAAFAGAVLVVCLGIVAAVACAEAGGPAPAEPAGSADAAVDTGAVDSAEGGASTCAAGSRICDGLELWACESGTMELESTCEVACSAELGCLVCQPNTARCEGEGSFVCSADGTSETLEHCDPALSLECDESTGRCINHCAPELLGRGNVGCEFYAITLMKAPAPSFGIAVSNAWDVEVAVTIDGGSLSSPIELDVPPMSVAVEELPAIPALTDASDSVLAGGAAYRVTSTRPVTVGQMSLQGGMAKSAEASLLLPVNALGSAYAVVAWRPEGTAPGFVAITASANDTTVTVTLRGDTMDGPGAPAIAAGVPATFTLQTGDVLRLSSTDRDLTGSLVTSDKPVQVISGHWGAKVPAEPSGSCCQYVSHLEEVMFPIDRLGTHHVVTRPAIPNELDPDLQLVRVVATEDGTSLVFDPEVAPPVTLQKAGESIQISDAGDFVVVASEPVLVAQYMADPALGPKDGAAPALTLAVASDEFSSEQSLFSLFAWPDRYLNVVGPVAANVTLNGQPVGALSPIGASGYGVARVQLGAGIPPGRVHQVSADVPVGVSVYAYAQGQTGWWTSYWHPAGLSKE